VSRTPNGPPTEEETELVLDAGGESEALLAASETSIEFWDNPIDDAIWNDA